ncbi:uncharacterized protein PpBr36_09572 [Pyricularia pennisetigena]|uniref:uncharacterized protein n=1 Tax=Pyricularia pennisetigena TaxID=1578925 RepID=UPI00115302B3|nr:uncharacterized protein PpBr36_09572 [Pyricularia pennisetigena]TLS21635.1 hypothetical protein PpBr36_09572 [Pyricularia pennisetigena]
MRFETAFIFMFASFALANCFDDCVNRGGDRRICQAFCNGELVFNFEAWEKWKKQNGH